MNSQKTNRGVGAGNWLISRVHLRPARFRHSLEPALIRDGMNFSKLQRREYIYYTAQQTSIFDCTGFPNDVMAALLDDVKPRGRE